MKRSNSVFIVYIDLVNVYKYVNAGKLPDCKEYDYECPNKMV